jgi:hypothetical protein
MLRCVNEAKQAQNAQIELEPWVADAPDPDQADPLQDDGEVKLRHSEPQLVQDEQQ